MEGPTPNPVQQDNFSNFSPPPKSGSGILIPLIVIVLLLLLGVGGAGWYFLRSAGKSPEGKVTTVPTEEFSLPTGVPTEVPAETNKSDLKIEILNGSGVTGEAAYAKGEVQKLGYTNITTGNTSPTDKTTTVIIYSPSVSQSVMDELTARMTELYKTVNVKTQTLDSKDIQITVGLRKGQNTSSPTPTKATATPKVSVTPSVTPRVSTTNTITPTKTPTPTTP